MNNFFTLFLILLLSITTSSSSNQPQSPEDEEQQGKSRRILHQPLFPAVPSPPPPPPQPADLPDPDQPFFHELPNGPTQPNQGPPTAVNPNSVASHTHNNNAKKVAIAAISISAVLALVIISALAFYLRNYRSRRNHDHSQKLFASADDQSPLPPPSNFLYIGTVEPSTRSTTMPNEINASPYRKLKPGKRSERYRPSPDLQPLPPLPKPPPPAIHSPPPMSSSSDDEDTNFYTPQGSSSMSNESPGSRNNNSRVVPHYSKRTSSPKPMIIPSIKHPPPPPPPPPPSSLGPLQPSKTLPYAPKRPKFAGPPPPPDMAKLRSISNDDHYQQPRQIPIPPPPPPPRKIGSAVVVEPYTPSPISKKAARPESMSPPSPPKAAINSGTDDQNDKKGGDREEEKDGSKPKLKPLHWDKVRATSERATVWDQLKSSSFQLNEDAMESLFGCNSASSVPKEMGNRNSALEQENRVLDPKKSQNIAILIRALNVTREEVSEALLDGNPEGLGPDLLETLVNMAPTKEEEIKLKDYKGDISKLGSAERFLKGILDIPFAFKRVEAMLYRANFDTEVAYLRNSFRALEEASEELKNSRLFLKLLEAVLRTGNRMNDGTNRGDARAFKLDTLLKLVDVKGADGKTTLLHFVVQEIIRSEGNENPTSSEFKEDEFRKQGLHVVSGLSRELGNVKKSAGMDSDVLSGYVSKLETGLEKVRSIMGYESGQKGKFFDSMRAFLGEAVGDITKIKSEERKALSRVIEVTEYFHGDAAKEEAHPLRIFLIVRDFLAILDNVCRDVGRMQVGATMGAGRSFRMPVVN